MKIQLFASDAGMLPIHEVFLTDLTYDFKERQFLLNSGYSKTPVLSPVEPTEMSIYGEKLNLHFKLRNESEIFFRLLLEASSEANRRSNSMLD